MNFTFLGTSSSLTELNRFYTNLLLQYNNYYLLIDSGEGISKQLIKLNYSFIDNIDSILITHFHSDHLSGLPSVLTNMKLYKREKPLTIYVYYKFVDILNNLLNTFLLFPSKFPFKLNLVPVKENEINSIIDDLTFTVKINSHVANKDYKTYYNEEIKPVSLSIMFSNNVSNLIYTSDIGNANDLQLFDLTNVQYFITEFSHIELEDIIYFLEVNKEIKLILAHYELNKLSKIYDNVLLNNFIKEKRLVIAQDGEKIKL